MSAIVCGKRPSSFFEDTPSSSSSSSSWNPVEKRIRCSYSPPRCGSLAGQSQPPPFFVDHLLSIFPFMDKQLIEQALENSGHDLDLAIKCLKDLHLGYGEHKQGAVDVFADIHSPSSNQAQVHDDEGGSTKNPTVSSDSPLSSVEWVELLVREMSYASDMDDARVRESKALEAFEKSIYAHVSADAGQSFQQENIMLKEQVQALLRENGILKRAVCIQHERQKEFEAKSQEVQQLKQLLRQCQELIRTLEVNNCALTMHLKRAQQKSTIPGYFIPDVF